MDNLQILMDGSKRIISLYNIPNNTNHDIYDPFNTIVCFGILYFKEEGSKLDLYNNTIYVNDKNIFQGAYRYLTGNNNFNLKLLYEPIVYACQFFLLSEYEVDVSSVFKLAIKGLYKLMNTYKSNQTTTNDLTIYINLITNSLEKDCDYIFLNQILDLSNSNDNNKTMKQNIYNALNNKWTIHKLNIVVSLFSELVNNNCYDSYNVMTSLQYIVRDSNQNTIKQLKL